MRFIRFLVTPAAFFLSQRAFAAKPHTFNVGGFFFGDMTFAEVIGNLISVLIATAFFVCASVFLIGATFYMTSAGAEDRKGYGKGMMVGAVIATAIIAGARGIMNATLFFLYGG